MEWTDIRLTVAKADADNAEAVATMIAEAASISRITATSSSRWPRSPMWI